MKQSFTIRIVAWHPLKEEKTGNHNYIGGRCRFVNLPDLEAAKDQGRQMWTEYFNGAMKQITILDSTSKILFTSDNFKHFRSSKYKGDIF